MNVFYTYAYLRKKNRTPYYIGKGCNNRAYKSHGYIHVPKDRSRIVFLKVNLTEEEAFKHEVYMITVFGRKDLGAGILLNRTNGGDGNSGAIRSVEYRQNLSERMIGKRLGENNPMFGKTHPPNVRKIISSANMGERNPNYGGLAKEHKDNISKGRKGKGLGNTWSEERKRKHSEKMKQYHQQK